MLLTRRGMLVVQTTIHLTMGITKQLSTGESWVMFYDLKLVRPSPQLQRVRS